MARRRARFVPRSPIQGRFVAREGRARVPSSHVENGFRLGAWVIEQRSAYREGGLSDERFARLEALPGWGWKARAEFSRPRPDGSIDRPTGFEMDTKGSR